jgi:hypothetical protein
LDARVFYRSFMAEIQAAKFPSNEVRDRYPISGAFDNPTMIFSILFMKRQCTISRWHGFPVTGFFRFFQPVSIKNDGFWALILVFQALHLSVNAHNGCTFTNTRPASELDRVAANRPITIENGTGQGLPNHYSIRFPMPPIGKVTGTFSDSIICNTSARCATATFTLSQLNALATADPTSVACNDLVRISLGADCVYTIQPDDVLEGTYSSIDDYYVEIDRIAPYGNGPWVPANLTTADIGNTYAYRLVHLISGNACWGEVLIEDKLAPTLTCPPNVTLHCNECSTVACVSPLGIDDCDVTTTQYTQVVNDPGTCTGVQLVYNRTWVVTDGSGNQHSCQQTVTIIPFDFDDLVFPNDITMNCADIATGAASTQPSYAGAPSIAGFPIGNNGLCAASVGYDDIVLNICAGDYEIIRRWLVRNACLPLGPNNPVEHYQLIKVIDTGGPIIACPANQTISTDATQCCATVNLPDAILTEYCSNIISWNASVIGTDSVNNSIQLGSLNGTFSDFPGNNYLNRDTLGVFGTLATCLQVGTYQVTYSAEDQCNNVTNCTFSLTVSDLTPPYPICHEFTQVGLGMDGQILVNAAAYNNGSTDNCNPVSFKVRRMDANPCQSNEQFLDQVRFCCSDIGDTVQVILRVYGLVLPAGAVALDAYAGQTNECMVRVFVEDKLRPTCTAPANVTVSCEAFDATLWSYGTALATDNCCLDTILVLPANYSRFDTVCNRGTITRQFRAVDCGSNTATCQQQIVVNYLQDYFVRFPNDVFVTTCNASGIYGEPVFFGSNCELMAVSHTDEIFTVVTDACFQIERTWSVVNWCTYTPNQPLITVPNPNPNATFNSPQNLQGPTVSEAGTLAPWAPSSIALLSGQPAFNYALLWNPNANGYLYKQLIRVIDTQDPVITGCQDSLHCDLSENDPMLWNATPWWDIVHQQHDLCEGELPASITVQDACSNAGLEVQYLLYLDLDGDGTQETVVNSINPPVPGEVNVGNAANQNFNGGTPVTFDQRNVPLSQKYRFALERTTTASGIVWTLKFSTQQAPNAYVPAQLPYGQHKIKWIVRDGCGNESTCIEELRLRDCKAPTVVCINGLTSNVGPNGTCPTLFATDFLQYTVDNCTPAAQLQVSIRRAGTGNGFPLDNNNQPVTDLAFSCDDLGTQFVEVWSRDKAGNASFCETYIIIQNPLQVCSNGTDATIAGALKTEEIEGVENVMVELNGMSNGAPTYTQDLTDVQGGFMFSNALPFGADYTITPTMMQDPKNGVTTYDLLLMSRHILNLEPLDSPYKMIAADANKSNTITSFDIVETRKLILGVYSEFPNNNSWRFVDRAQAFTNPQNPFDDVLQEDIAVAQIQASVYDENFVGIKIGDLNMSAQANDLMATDDRSAGTLVFDLITSTLSGEPHSGTIKEGDEFVVHFAASQPQAGYQFTLNINALEVVEIIPGTDLSQDNFAVFDDAITTSAHASAGRFAIRFRAAITGQLRDMIRVSSRITPAVGYNTAGENLDVALHFVGSQPQGVGFEVYQNVPNPWVTKTSIGFHLPAADRAVLTVYDQTGRVVWTQEGDFAKGYHAFVLHSALLTATGSLYYTITTSTDSGTKQMIQVR